MSTINYTYNVIVDRFRQFAAGHFQLRRFTHGEISQADLEKEAEWPWLHVKPRAINYSPGTRSFQFEIFISDLPRDKEDKTGYQAESITDCSLIFQDLINEIYLGNMFGSDVVLTRPVSSEPFVEQYTHTLTGVTGTIELSLDYDWSACSIPASWNYNTPTDSGTDGWGALQFIESLDQNGVFVSLDGDVEAPGNSYYYGTNALGVKGWYAIVDNVGLTCETLPECATIISIADDIAALQSDKVDKVAGKGLSTEDYTTAEKSKLAGIEAGAEVNVNADWNAVSGDAQILNKPSIPAAQVNSDWNATSGVAQILNKPTIPSIAGLVPETRTLTINGTTQDLSANRTFTIATGLTVGTTPITSGTVGRVLFEGTGNVLQEDSGLSWNNSAKALNIISASTSSTPFVRLTSNATTDLGGVLIEAPSVIGAWPLLRVTSGGVTAFQVDGARTTTIQSAATASTATALSVPFGRVAFESDVASGSVPLLSLKNNGAFGTVAKIDTGASFATGWILLDVLRNGTSQFTILAGGNTLVKTGNVLIGTTTDAGFKLDVNGTARVSGATTITAQTKVGTTVYADTSCGLILGKVGASNAARGFLASDTNYQDFGFCNTSISSGSINAWTFGQRQDTYFGNSLGSFQIVGGYFNNAGTGSMVGGGFRVPLICNPDGTIILSGAANSINGNVLVGGTTNIASGAFQIESTTKGFLPPRMTTTQKNAIASPASGLVVYDTTLGKLCVRGAAAWETITSV